MCCVTLILQFSLDIIPVVFCTFKFLIRFAMSLQMFLQSICIAIFPFYCRFADSAFGGILPFLIAIKPMKRINRLCFIKLALIRKFCQFIICNRWFCQSRKIKIVKMFLRTINCRLTADSENPSPIIPVSESVNFSTSAIPMSRIQTVPIQTSSVNLTPPGITTA